MTPPQPSLFDGPPAPEPAPEAPAVKPRRRPAAPPVDEHGFDWWWAQPGWDDWKKRRR